MKTLQVTGTHSSGGLGGPWQSTQNLTDGRYSDACLLGPIDTAAAHAWRRDIGGEVAVPDAPTALRRTRSQSWLGARAYW